MGSQNVRQIEAMLMSHDARLKGISGYGLALLLVMATNARDDQGGADLGRLYFRGWDHLAMVLGYAEYDGRAERAVARYLADLRTRGLVEPVAWRHTGRGNRVYELHLLP